MRLILIVILLHFAIAQGGHTQGFVNLNFESANVSGYPPGSSSVPTNMAIPGWSASYAQPGAGGSPASQIWYDAISLGGCVISINDSNTDTHSAVTFVPLEGRFSSILFGGTFDCSSTISQTGLVPSGTESLQFKIGPATLFGVNQEIGSFTVSLGGQSISMTPLAVFSSYTLFGGDVSAFANHVATLSITADGVPIGGGGGPNPVWLDDIVFSPQAIPEPSTLGLFAFGASLLGLRFLNHRS